MLVVRTYRQVDVSYKDLQTAREYAEAAFATAGVGLVWVDCAARTQADVDAAPTCSTPVSSNEVILRIQAAGAVGPSPYASMGVSLVNTDAEAAPPMVSTVFADRVTAIARVAGVDARRVLGYACAHEIGHLLLNRAGHPETGLMRAIFSGVELRRNRPADWVFPAEDAATIRNAVVARSALHS